MICCSISSHRLSCLACNPASFLLRVRCSYLGLRFWEEALAILNSHGVTTYIVEEKFEEWIQDPVIQASLVVQWLRIRLPTQGTRVRALVWEDPTCRGATKPMRHNY